MAPGNRQMMSAEEANADGVTFDADMPIVDLVNGCVFMGYLPMSEASKILEYLKPGAVEDYTTIEAVHRVFVDLPDPEEFADSMRRLLYLGTLVLRPRKKATIVPQEVIIAPKGPLPDLSADCLSLIFSRLSLPEVAVASCVCKLWNKLAKDPGLWSHVSLQMATDKALEGLMRHYPVQHLDVSTTLVSDRGLIRALQAGPALRGLKLPSRSDDETISDVLQIERELEDLSCEGDQSRGSLTHVSLVNIAKDCAQLTRLSLANQGIISATQWTGFFNLHRPWKLKSLNIANTGVKAAALQAIGETCPDLETLVLSGTLDGVKGGLAKCLRTCLVGCPKLTSLDLEQTEADNSILTVISECCPALTALSLAFSPISEKAFERVKPGTVPLTKLSLERCPGDFDKGARTLGTVFPGLTDLNLRGTSFSDAGLEALATVAKHLRVVNLWHCRTTPAGRAQFSAARPGVVVRVGGRFVRKVPGAGAAAGASPGGSVSPAAGGRVGGAPIPGASPAHGSPTVAAAGRQPASRQSTLSPAGPTPTRVMGPAAPPAPSPAVASAARTKGSPAAGAAASPKTAAWKPPTGAAGGTPSPAGKLTFASLQPVNVRVPPKMGPVKASPFDPTPQPREEEADDEEGEFGYEEDEEEDDYYYDEEEDEEQTDAALRERE